MFPKKIISSMLILGVLALGFLNIPNAFAVTAVEVIEKDAKYQSQGIQVRVGQTIRLVNKDAFYHQSQIRKVDEFGIEWPLVVSVLEPEGASVEVSLDEAGSYKLRCKIHDGMILNIEVTE